MRIQGHRKRSNMNENLFVEKKNQTESIRTKRNQANNQDRMNALLAFVMLLCCGWLAAGDMHTDEAH